MDANELRRAFVDFFVARDHVHEPSASLIPHDPSLLFTVAGMVPYKPYFLGEEQPPYPRVVTVQKCVRAGGKHNDLDEIGRTSRHLTFFEMLGNFSFGDYFKAEAIPWAWEFVTQVLQLDPERLWVTVHVSDDEAARIWRDDVGVPEDRIQRLDEDNYWRMAETGPCGPCSEIFWDKGPDHGEPGGPAHGGQERYVEIWNLVFMQFDQQPDGTLLPLPKPSIDTGAGLERMLSVLQGVDSVWETDLFRSLLSAASELTSTPYGADERKDVSLRILADHARSTTFLIADGVFPSNEDRGYVLRRIIRRAIRHAYLLGVERAVMPGMVDAVVEVMGADRPELVKSHEFVRGVVSREEERFRQTLATGSALLDEAISELVATGGGDGSAAPVLPGSVAFKLHDTYGMPLEVTEEIAAERGVAVDVEGFEAEMAEQKRRAKDARREAEDGEDLAPYQEVLEDFGPTEFVGREHDRIDDARVLLVTPEWIVLDRTPFYAEAGGQVGDTGEISTETGRAQVVDTAWVVGSITRHRIGEVEGTITEGQTAVAAIDSERRAAIRRNHTGTHVLHWALRQVLGDHVKQQGSWVGPDRLRFDFSHYEALSPETIREIEDIANREILDNASVRHYETSRQHAEELGAIAFFGDKYGDVVRVLEAGRHSIELCGGTHVKALGDIGALKIVSEGSIGSNLRRIEAITGLATLERLREAEGELARAAGLLGVPADSLVEGIEKRLDELKELRDELRTLRTRQAMAQASDLAASAVDGVVVAQVEGIERDALRDLAVAVRDKGPRAVVLGLQPEGGGAALVAAVAPGSGLDAGQLLKQVAPLIGGGGKAQPEVSMIGGRHGDKIPEALEQIRAALAAAPVRG